MGGDMPIQQKLYKVRESYSSLYNGVVGGRDEVYKVEISSINSVVEKLKQFIREDNLSALTDLLNSEFVHSESVDHKTVSSRHNEAWEYGDCSPPLGGRMPWNHDLGDMSFGERMQYQHHYIPKKLISYQSDTTMYDVHNVQPVLEVLISSQNFKDIYELACQQRNGSLEVILVSMSNKDFTGADLSAFDLSNADFNHSDLSQVKLGKIDEADFTNANLTTTFMTKKLLYTAKTYQDAKLPAGYWRFWTEETKLSLIRKIEELRLAAGEYKDSDPIAHNKANELAQALDKMINSPNAKYHEQFQRDFLIKLRSYDEHFAHAPLIKAVIGSIALFILSAGIGYIIALGIRAYTTQNRQMLFFNQTAVETKITNIEKIITNSQLLSVKGT